MTVLRSLLRIPLLCVSTLLFASVAMAQQPVRADHSSQLGAISADALANGDVVVTLVATGDLQGLITLTLHPANSGYTGEWGFTVAHADNTDPVTGLDPELNEQPEQPGVEPPPDRGYLRLIQQGTLQGAVSTASVSVGADGALTVLSASLVIDSGAKEFDGATGTGQATLSGLTLTF